ncbi:hypothetical protein COV18_01675 [Candidatus Woesearchaeota archaeon CG10_big_fil_rev_8_21_14_0_10_37_12]|nr:MAG: hypothetical protein COV18_01675 [Candidatus Woesearchaeota archaeon CG10_big_fil_rev_8_21_14_0_10_37_12]
MLKDFTPRLYQETILATAALKNTLAVLPTGMGKTGIAILLTAQRLSQYPKSKILILAPTKPLAEQHLNTFKKHLDIDEDKFVLFTGNTPPAKRSEQWNKVQIIFSTPQGLENDIISNSINIKDISLLVFDEAHRATGDYSYVFIAKQYQQKADWPLILALTASPGGDVETIENVCKNLFIEAVEVRTENDPDVQPYVQETEISTIRVELPEQFKKIQQLLKQCIQGKTNHLKEYGIRATNLVTKKDLLGLQKELHAKVASGEKDFEAFKATSVLAEIMKAHHALELLETQGTTPLINYFENMYQQSYTSKIKAVKNLTADLAFKSSYILTQKLIEQNIEHPKLAEVTKHVTEQLAQNKYAKIILFTQYRDTATKLHDELDKLNVLSQVFVGQAKKRNTGLSQKQQAEVLDQFRDGMFNVLIATSVAEEGLDIPKVDSVIFFEPIPSAIRHVQRRGRTGRQEKGDVTIFLTKGTREEAYAWSAKHKERRMNDALGQLRTRLQLKINQQPTLKQFDTSVKIFADYREKTTGTVKELVEQGVTIKLEMLKSADYLLSSRVGVELKTMQDFVDSIVDGRLLEQIKNLKEHYERPIVIIQGKENIYGLRNIHPNAIRGMLGTIAVGYCLPILYTQDEKDTAALLITIAKREQEENKKEFSPHADRKPMTIKEQQEYLVSCLPSVGPNLAKELLKQFGSIRKIFDANEEQLKQVKGLGDKIAKGITGLIEGKYK